MPQAAQPLVRPLNMQQQPSKARIHMSTPRQRPLPAPAPAPQNHHSHLLPIALLKPVHLPMADIVVRIRQRHLAAPRLAPPRLAVCRVVLAPVERQRARDRELDGLARGDGVQLAVDVERELQVLSRADDARDAVVLLVVDFGDCEGRVEEEGVGTGGGSAS